MGRSDGQLASVGVEQVVGGRNKKNVQTLHGRQILLGTYLGRHHPARENSRLVALHAISVAAAQKAVHIELHVAVFKADAPKYA